MKENTKTVCVEAQEQNLACVMQFAEDYALSLSFSQKVVRRLLLVCDEILSNIVKFAYPQKTGKITLEMFVETKTQSLTMRFLDEGVPFNPLAEKEPNLSLSLEQRPVGKLGIKIVKTIAESVDYAYQNGKNILTIVLKKQ